LRLRETISKRTKKRENERERAAAWVDVLTTTTIGAAARCW